jgi:Fe-S cluster assembly protein SufB
MNELKNKTNFEINQVINEPYKYGFETKIEKEEFPKGLNKEIIALISNKKNEPDFLKKFRLNAFKKWIKLKSPNWANLSINPINNYQSQQFHYFQPPFF